ncbi:MAG TPA: FxsA family protein [Nocardioidaceae bacterium]|nr:FxsA family protein [Nocardioidaceae bacterium]
MVEIYFLIQIGQVIGPWWTILLLVADGVLGSVLVRNEGRRAWAALNTAISSHRMPHKELADGALILIGGTLLLTPGFVTDAFGLFCVLPFTRPIARKLLARAISRRIVTVNLPPPPTGDRVVPGEVVD